MTDILIENGRLRTSAGWSEGRFLAVKDGKISALGNSPAPEEIRASARQVLSAKGCVVLPGLTNAHTHLSQTFMRGLSGGRPLMRWLKELIWPLQAAMSLEELKLAAMLGLVENLRCGATDVVDHQKITKTTAFSEAVLSSAEEIGVRFTLARAWADKGVNAESSESIVSELEFLLDRCQGKDRLRISSGPLTPWRATAATLQNTHALAQQYSSGTHIHVSETTGEVTMMVEESGMRPVAWLASLGVLDQNTQIVHAVWVDSDEICLLKERDALVVHCPVSNAVLGSGSAPVQEMLEAGVRVQLGTDGPASNDNQDPFENMKMAVCTARLRSLDPTHLSPAAVLDMALAGKQLSVGKEADLIFVDLEHLRAAPVQDIDSALVLCCSGSDVKTVIAGGKILMQDKKILVLDEEALLKECQAAVSNMRKRAGLN